MALTITKLKMWADPGYTRNCPEVPVIGSKKLPAADWASAQDVTFRPSPGSTLTSLKIPLSYSAVFNMSYMYIEASDGYGNIALFGWIDNITQSSTSSESVTINWTVDWWRSYSGDVTFKSGIITKSPDSTHKRPYRTQPRHWKISSVSLIRESAATPSLWVYIPAVWTVKKNNEDVTTQIITLIAPVGGSFVIAPGSQTVLNGPSLEFLYGGLIDELVANIGSSTVTVSIINVYLAPIAPDDFTFNGTYWQSNVITYAAFTSASGTSIMMGNGPSPVVTMSASISPVMTDDTTRAIITDCDGNEYGTLPYGVQFDSIEGVLDIGGNGGYLNLTFKSSALFPQGIAADSLRKASRSMGCGFSIPLPSVPVTENQWSDYMRSGQRDYDITSARIANEQKAINGIESSIQSGIGGGVAGASAGPFGAVIGAIGGAAATGIMTGVNYGLGENFNKQLQEAKEQMYANQKNGIMLTGNSYNKLYVNNAYYPMLIIETADSVSAGEMTNDITLNGYDTNISGNLSTIITSATTGPYQIINMTITGSVPPQAKQYIKDKFAQGIRLIENNPSGVTP